MPQALVTYRYSLLTLWLYALKTATREEFKGQDSEIVYNSKVTAAWASIADKSRINSHKTPKVNGWAWNHVLSKTPPLSYTEASKIRHNLCGDTCSARLLGMWCGINLLFLEIGAKLAIGLPAVNHTCPAFNYINKQKCPYKQTCIRLNFVVKNVDLAENDRQVPIDLDVLQSHVEKPPNESLSSLCRQNFLQSGEK